MKRQLVPQQGAPPELAADERWEAAFAESRSVPKRLADEAVSEHRASRTEALDPDAL